jgi:hypothetical protein
MTRDPTPLDEVERCDAEADAATVTEYLADAVRRGVIAPDVVDALRRDVERTGSDETAPSPWPAPPPTATTPAAAAPTHFPPPCSERPVVATGRVRAVDEPKDAYPLEPGRASLWWGAARHAIKSDVALHGLAYLGVLLLFVGITGLIAFSFGDVAPWVRTLTEVFVPGALFLAAWYLRRRGAVTVGTSLALLGGIVTPIIVAASLTDGAPFPPDPAGRALPIIQGVLVASVAVVMAFIVRREPSGPFRFLVAPVAWMAAGLAAGVVRDPVPTGYDVARPESIQLAGVLAALTTTVLLFRRRRVPGALTDATLAIALPIAGVTYVLEFVLARNEGWPVWTTLIVGVAVLLLLELLHQRLPTEVASILQFVVIAATAARLSATATPVWVAAGAAVALLAFLEHVGRDRPTPAAIVVGFVLAGSAFLATLGEPWPAAVAFGVLTIWGLWRHVLPAEWLPVHDDVGAVPAFAIAVTAGSLWMLSDLGLALVVTSALVLLLALAGRLWRWISDDVLWRWFVPAVALAVSAFSATLPWRDASIEVAVATVFCAVALLSSVAPMVVRVWPAAAMVAWSLANFGAALGVSRNVQAVVLAVMAMTVTVGSVVAATRAHADPVVWGHVAVVGHVTGLIALAVPTWPGWAAAGVVAAATVGWWATTVADESGEAVHLALLRAEGAMGSGRLLANLTRGRSVDEVAPLMSLAGTWATVLLVVDAAGWITFDNPWMAVVSSGFVLVAAAVVRLVHWRRSRRRVLEWATLVAAVLSAAVSITAVGSNPDQWSPVVSLALGIAVVGATAAPRPLVFNWSAWVGSALLAVFFLDRLGMPRDWADIVLAGWGAAVLLGGLALNRARHGPVPPGKFVSGRLLLPPTALGAIAFSLGGALGLTEGSQAAIGWTAAVLSIVVLAVALLLPLGAPLALAEGLATAAYVAIAPWKPLERPWTLAPWAVILLLAALATRRSGPWSLSRWDLPSFLIAHGVACVALIAAIDAESVTATYSAFGAISIAIGLVLRRPVWVAAGAMLVLIVGADAGYGWLALVLLVEGLGLTLGGIRQENASRWVLLGLGTTSLTAAWFALAAWQSWGLSTVVYITMPAAAVIALVAAVCLRAVLAPRELWLVWMAAGPFVATGVTWIGIGEISRQPGGLILTGSLLLLAATAGVSAIELGGGMRWIACALAAAAWAPAAWATEPSALAATLIGTTVALAGTAEALAVHGLRPAAVWVPPASFYVALTQAGAAYASLAALPDVDPIVVALVAIAAEIVAFGVLTGWRELHVLAPVVACAAWLVFATDALEGDANWFVMPIGLTVLVVSALVRWIRRGRGGNVTGYDVIALEFVGMTALVASALARTLTGQLWHGVLAIGIGVLVAGWGILTQVRWRAAFGAASVLLATILLVAVPLSGAVTWRGPALWITLSVVGIAAITIASLLERNLARMQQVARRFDQMTTGWERVPLHRTGRNGTSPTATMDETSSSKGQPAH